MAFSPTEKPALPHSLSLDSRSRLTLAGVTQVPQFDESTVVCVTTQGTLVIHGADLHLGQLSLDSGQVAVDGTVHALIYEEGGPKGFFGRLFGG